MMVSPYNEKRPDVGALGFSIYDECSAHVHLINTNAPSLY